MLDTGQVTALTREDVGILVLTPGILMGSPDTGGCGDIRADEHWHYIQIPRVLACITVVAHAAVGIKWD